MKAKYTAECCYVNAIGVYKCKRVCQYIMYVVRLAQQHKEEALRRCWNCNR